MVEYLTDLGNGMWVARADLNELRAQDVNARTMSTAMFERLSINIKRRGGLESLPFCAEVNGTVEIVSGHHRAKAAREAGLPTIYVLVDRSGLDRDAIVAKQLAHNAISGDDDAQTLALLLLSIQDQDRVIETYLDPKEYQGIRIKAPEIPELDVGLQWTSIAVMFLPNDFTQFDLAIASIGAADQTMVAPWDTFEKFKAAVKATKGAHNVKNLGATLAIMSDIVLAHLEGKKNAPPAPETPPQA